MEVPRRLDPWVPASLSGMWRDSLLFRYVVQAGERDSDGVGVPADPLSLHGRRISSLAGSNARLTLGDRTFENDPGFKLDGSRGRTRNAAPWSVSGQRLVHAIRAESLRACGLASESM